MLAALEGEELDTGELLDDFIVSAAGDDGASQGTGDGDDEEQGDEEDLSDAPDLVDDNGVLVEGSDDELDEVTARIIRDAIAERDRAERDDRAFHAGNRGGRHDRDEDDYEDDYGDDDGEYYSDIDDDDDEQYRHASGSTRKVMRLPDARGDDQDTLGYKAQDGWSRPRRGKVIYLRSEQDIDGDEPATVPDTVLDQQFERVQYNAHLSRSRSLSCLRVYLSLSLSVSQMMEKFDDDEIGELDREDPTVKGRRSLAQFQDVLDSFLDESSKNLSDHTNTKMDPELKKFVLSQVKRKAVRWTADC